MSMTRLLRAAFAACALALSFAPATHAQTLRVLEGAVSTSLRVPMNRAVVVESDAVFAELSVANPAIADIATLSERTIYVLGRAPGRTTMTLLGVEGQLIANVEVQVVPDVAELRERLSQILPGEPIEVRTANDGIVLSGTLSSGEAVDHAMQLAERYSGNVSNLMYVSGSQQVLLQVRFAEMSRTTRQNLSASLQLSDGGFQFGTGVATGGGGTTLGDGTLGGATGGLSLGFGSNGAQVGILLEALETEGLVRTLAEPNIVALSGQSASFLAGGELPVPTQSDNGVGVEFKPFGITLNFSPTVVQQGVINLVLDTEVSSLGEEIQLGGGAQIPSLSTRSATTTVNLRDGESFAIAGLLQDDFRDSVGQVPWLGDIPVLGALFRSSNWQRNQTELVVIVTAHLVSPTRGEALSLPTDRVAIPSERDLFLFGQTVGRVPGSGPAADVAQQDFGGSYGYVME
ncbi:general secretion pathway protein [Rhodobacterales bacterium HKCCE3408]|nr:general secretion pathway protein [Rhodobacterales bacterium HKCCE3408]